MRKKPPIDPQLELVNARFADFDQLSESVRGWDLDFRQLDRGESPSHLRQIQGSELDLLYLNLDRRYDQAGAAPPGQRTLALVEEGVRGARWCGREVLPSTLQTFRADGDFEAISEPGFRVYTISFSQEWFAALADRLGLPELDECLAGDDFQLRDAAGATDLRRTLRAIFAGFDDGTGADPSLFRERMAELPEQLMLTIAAAQPEARLPPLSSRSSALRNAVEWIESHLDSAPRIVDVCHAAGVSRRTLEYAFREHYGVTPKTYLMSRRLVAVRAELRRSGPGERVVEVANRFGFWHMGDFAAAYHRHFGERPSETLGRVQGRTGSAATAGI